MNLSVVLDNALPIIGVLLGIAAIILLLEAVATLRKARATIGEVNEKLAPTLENISEISEDLKPLVKNAAPMMERASLTLDAANLEIMRLDGILENVTTISQDVSSATNAVNTVASAPTKVVGELSEKVVGLFKKGGASPQSIALGEGGKHAARPLASSGAVRADAPEDVAGEVPEEETVREYFVMSDPQLAVAGQAAAQASKVPEEEEDPGAED